MVVISGFVRDAELTGSGLADALRIGPRVLGLLAMVVVAAGLRSGVNGGPVSVEAGDVQHLLLSPVPRSAVLMRPAVQRLRTMVGIGVVAGAIAGQLAARRLPGSLTAWAAAGAVYGAMLGLLSVGSALIAHAWRLPRVAASAIGFALIGAQAASIATGRAGIGQLAGRVGFWGVVSRPVDLVAPAVALALVAIGLAGVGRLSLEALQRRSGLVSQMRFAATLQDMRTVVLLRRQLGHEQPRSRPWLNLAIRETHRSVWLTVWRRGWRGLLRAPGSRVIRMILLAAGVGLTTAAALRGTTPAILVAGLLAFILGLEVLEPLAQEVDQPTLSASLPVRSGQLSLSHVAAPMAALVPLAAIMAVTTLLVLQQPGLTVAVLVTALPALAGGAAGGAMSIGKSGMDEVGAGSAANAMPPEIAGMVAIFKLLQPPALSTASLAGLLLLRQAGVKGWSLTAVTPGVVAISLTALALGMVVLGTRAAFMKFFQGIMGSAASGRTVR